MKAMTRRDEIILHLERHCVEIPTSLHMPYSTTMHGMSDATGMTRAHVAGVTQQLMDEGLVERVKANVDSRRAKLQSYYLTPAGVMEAQKLHRMIAGEIFYENDTEWVIGALDNLKKAQETVEKIRKRKDDRLTAKAIRYVYRAMDDLTREANL
ncbi:MAG: hypothetical protein Q4Q58_06205 [Thermoplasmata archaeon]|nr:hypothetical protein [Thermoplasmata archaeon]